MPKVLFVYREGEAIPGFEPEAREIVPGEPLYRRAPFRANAAISSSKVFTCWREGASA